MIVKNVDHPLFVVIQGPEIETERLIFRLSSKKRLKLQIPSLSFYKYKGITKSSEIRKKGVLQCKKDYKLI